MHINDSTTSSLRSISDKYSVTVADARREQSSDVGAKHSLHKEGEAVDLRIDANGRTKEEVEEDHYNSGFSTVGFIKEYSKGVYNFHADTRKLKKGKTRRKLFYANGKYSGTYKDI